MLREKCNITVTGPVDPYVTTPILKREGAATVVLEGLPMTRESISLGAAQKPERILEYIMTVDGRQIRFGHSHSHQQHRSPLSIQDLFIPIKSYFLSKVSQASHFTQPQCLCTLPPAASAPLTSRKPSTTREFPTQSRRTEAAKLSASTAPAPRPGPRARWQKCVGTSSSSPIMLPRRRAATGSSAATAR